MASVDSYDVVRDFELFAFEVTRESEVHHPIPGFLRIDLEDVIHTKAFELETERVHYGLRRMRSCKEVNGFIRWIMGDEREPLPAIRP